MSALISQSWKRVPCSLTLRSAGWGLAGGGVAWGVSGPDGEEAERDAARQ
jgi:hypothetical protein